MNQYGEKDSGVWQAALDDLTEELIQQGLYTMLRDERFETWPPNCTQFRKLCLSGLKNHQIPSVHEAFAEAQQNFLSTRPAWSHIAIKYTVKCLTSERVNDAKTYEVFQEFQAKYAEVCERILQGEAIPQVDDKELVIQPKQTCMPPPRLATLLNGKKT